MRAYVRLGLAIVFAGGALLLACSAVVDAAAPIDDEDANAPDGAAIVDGGGNPTDGEPALGDAGPDVARERAATPSFTPPPGTFNLSESPAVTMATTTPGATIHFTVDGSMPTTDSPVYTQPLCVGFSKTILAIATAPDHDPSLVAGGQYFINVKGGLAPVAFNPSSGEYTAPVAVALSVSGPATICFTMDESPPTCTFQSAGVDASVPCHPVYFNIAGCGVGSTAYDAGSPIELTPPPDGGTITIKAMPCFEQGGAGDRTIATYVFAPP